MNINVRIFYTKTGRAKYISHLDVNRCMQRNIKRSGLPVWYTEGFNPHLYITFPLPISLCHQSLCESMDIKVDESVSFEEIKTRLSEVLPEDFDITNVAAPIMKPDRIAFAEYELLLASETVPPCDIADRFWEFIAQDEIVVPKKTKKGMIDIDIKPFILIHGTKAHNDCLRISARFKASIMQSINPTLLLNAFFDSMANSVYAKEITRLSLTDEDGNNFR